MSLIAKPETCIMTGNAGISETLKRQGYVKTLCFSIDPITDERALDTIREGICDIHITSEQLQDLREKVAGELLGVCREISADGYTLPLDVRERLQAAIKGKQ